MILLDTSALLFWTLDQEKLPAATAEVIKAANSVALSSISIWEIGIKAQKGRLEIPYHIDEYAEKLKTVRNVEILPVDVPVWLKSLALDWSHRDPADRVIVATAVLNTCPLITSDRVIRAYYKDTVW